MTSAVLLPLRTYQRAAIAGIQQDWDTGIRRPAVVLPTGAGKTVIFGHLVKEWATLNPDKRVLILVHTDELVNQAVRKLYEIARGLTVGIVKGARNEVFNQVIVASVQSLRNEKRRRQLRSVGLVIVDECHHATAVTYRKILEHYGALICDQCHGHGMTKHCEFGHDIVCRACGGKVVGQARALAVGFTATLARGDGESLADIWQKVAYRQDVLFMIRSRFLVNVRGKRVKLDDFDLRNVKRSGADFQSSALGEELERSLAPEIVAAAYAKHAGDRRGLAFWPTVHAAQLGADAMNALGIKTEVVHGGLATAERRAILGRLQAGTTQVVANCMVLTEGFDDPSISCVVVARPTRSAPLYQQMVGRGLRVDHTKPWEEQDCLILDVVGASTVHGLASLIDLTERHVPLKEDQLITEAVDEAEAEAAGEGDGGEQDREDFVRGPTKIVDFDPLAGMSKVVWNRSAGGTWYLIAGAGKGSRYILVVPGAYPATYTLCWVTQSHKDFIGGKRGGFVDIKGERIENVPLDSAFAWGESIMEGYGSQAETKFSQAKTATWRRGPVTADQRYRARMQRIEIPEGATCGEVSRLIDIATASPRIDSSVKIFEDMIRKAHGNE